MRLKEILEAKIGTQTSLHRMSAPSVSTIDPSAPWTKKQRAVAYKRAKDFNELTTAKEKFEYIKKVSEKNPSNALRILPPNVLGNPLHIQTYDPATGNIVLLQHTSGETVLFQGNVNQFEYKGRVRAPTGSKKYYEFIPTNIKEISRELKPVKTGRPVQAKPFSKPSTLTKLPW
jgi:hypothetical protein